MKIGNIVKPNEKGQIVILQKIRQDLGITSDSYLQLVQTEDSLIIHPIKDVDTQGQGDIKKSYLELLRKTAGSWAGDDWPKIEARRRKIELAASRRRKNQW